MNNTHIEHAFVAAVITLLGWLAGYVWIGAALAIGIFIGREHAQREYEIGNPMNLIGYEALDLWRWSKDALLDLALPVVAALVVAFVMP
jgi:hypothetical protein